jgi:hypothetical protein
MFSSSLVMISSINLAIDLAYYLARVWVQPSGCSLIVLASLSLLGVTVQVHL